MSVGDIKSTEKGSGARYNAGKPAMDLVPLVALEDCAAVFDYGRKKYAEWNWAKGMDWSVPYACALRHLSAWHRGEDLDPESGLPHLGHVMCNLVMLSTYAKTYPEGDNRPKEWFNIKTTNKEVTPDAGSRTAVSLPELASILSPEEAAKWRAAWGRPPINCS